MSYVLIVEDHREYANIMGLLLQQMDLPYVHAADGKQAIEKAEADKPMLILLDLELPEMNGWQVLDKLKETYGEHGFPVIVSTAQADLTNRMIGRFQYVKHYITKPYELSILRNAIEEVLELYKVSV